MIVREPTKKELLWEIRQLLYKLVYGNEAEGIEPLVKHKSNSNFDCYKSLEKRIKQLEEKVEYLETFKRITCPSIINPLSSEPVPVSKPYEELPHIYHGHSDDTVMFNKQYEAHQKAIDNILEGSSIDDPKIK